MRLFFIYIIIGLCGGRDMDVGEYIKINKNCPVKKSVLLEGHK